MTLPPIPTNQEELEALAETDARASYLYQHLGYLAIASDKPRRIGEIIDNMHPDDVRTKLRVIGPGTREELLAQYYWSKEISRRLGMPFAGNLEEFHQFFYHVEAAD